MNLYPHLIAPYPLCTLVALNHKLPVNERFRGITNDMTPSVRLLELLNAGPAAIDLSDGDITTNNGIETNGVWHYEYRAFTAREVLNEEIAWVYQEMTWADEEMEKHNDGHSRLNGSLQQMKTFRNDLRNYIRDSKTDSPYIEGTKPTTRPGS